MKSALPLNGAYQSFNVRHMLSLTTGTRTFRKDFTLPYRFLVLPHGFHVEISTWIPCGNIHLDFLAESPARLLFNSTWNLGGIYMDIMESMWTPSSQT